jgi:ATP phosphoribosyltransferase
MTQLTIAIAKGRLQRGTLELFARSGLCDTSEALSSRRLTFEDASGHFRFIFVKPRDVPVYVAHGVADCGVVGRDVLLESQADLLQPLTLDIGHCRIVVAAVTERLGNGSGMLRVATKYPRIASTHFGERGQPVEVIELSGSVELAPGMGLADCIVDLVETGRTLQDNGLRMVEVIAESTARLVVNRASYQLKAKEVGALVAAFEAIRSLGEVQSD